MSYTDESAYPRVSTMLDGTGTTSYTYHAAGGLGAGQMASVDGPLTDDTITYAYDALGRVVERAINGTANTVTYTFDALGRVTTEANVLGTFTYGYDGPTSRVASVTDSSGNAATQPYEVDSTGNLQSFAYDANGNLTNDGSRTFEWDARNQLVAVSVGTHRSEFAYDGLQRRAHSVEREEGVIQSDTSILWCENGSWA